MSKFEKRLCVFALVFVAVYLGAAALTIHSRLSKNDAIERIESAEITPVEGQLLLVELFLPMTILLTLTVCFIIVRKQRAKKWLKLDEPDEMFAEPHSNPDGYSGRSNSISTLEDEEYKKVSKTPDPPAERWHKT